MPPAATFLISGLVLAAVLITMVSRRARAPRGPSRTVADFRRAMRAIAPRGPDER